MDTVYKLIPPRCHDPNVLKTKHGMIRSVFLRFANADDNGSRFQALHALRISNDLNGSDIVLVFEKEKGFTAKLVVVLSSVIENDRELFEAQLQPDTKRS